MNKIGRRTFLQSATKITVPAAILLANRAGSTDVTGGHHGRYARPN
jgi:hypothetical protein